MTHKDYVPYKSSLRLALIQTGLRRLCKSHVGTHQIHE